MLHPAGPMTSQQDAETLDLASEIDAVRPGCLSRVHQLQLMQR